MKFLRKDFSTSFRFFYSITHTQLRHVAEDPGKQRYGPCFNEAEMSDYMGLFRRIFQLRIVYFIFLDDSVHLISFDIRHELQCASENVYSDTYLKMDMGLTWLKPMFSNVLQNKKNGKQALCFSSNKNRFFRVTLPNPTHSPLLLYQSKFHTKKNCYIFFFYCNAGHE